MLQQTEVHGYRYMLTISTYLRWMDVLNEGEDILEKVLNEVWMMHMLLFFMRMDGLGNESRVVIAIAGVE